MKRILILTLTIAAVFASSCKKDPGCPPPPKEDPAKCEKQGKFVNAICGWGVYGSWWIQLDDGTLLQPCASDVPLIDANTIYEGMPVSLSYTQRLEKDMKCASPLTCMAWPGEHISVTITCLTAQTKKCPDETTVCNHQGMLRDKRGKLDGCGWIIELNTGETLDVGMQIDETQWDDDTPVLVGYREIQNVWNPCMAGTVVELTCIRIANTTTR